jgi:hypothetical protein
MLTASQLSRSGRVIRGYFLVFFGFFFSFRMPVPFAMGSPPLVGLSSDYTVMPREPKLPVLRICRGIAAGGAPASRRLAVPTTGEV